MRRLRLVTPLLFLQMLLATSLAAQPAQQFTELENRLLESRTLSLLFRVNASGAVAADIEANLRKAANGDIELSAAGVFAGQDIDLILTLHGTHFEYGHRLQPTQAEPPQELWQALVIGLTRMGILHNIAVLSAGNMPDHANGGVADWVLASNVQHRDESFAFDILVDGIPAGSASLSFDEPVSAGLRSQTVTFPGGQMRVREEYLNIIRSE
ncbi:MAG: hypothetical protein WDZ52_05730 [Pseudohongiellaceae bacterium]